MVDVGGKNSKPGAASSMSCLASVRLAAAVVAPSSELKSCRWECVSLPDVFDTDQAGLDLSAQSSSNVIRAVSTARLAPGRRKALLVPVLYLGGGLLFWD